MEELRRFRHEYANPSRPLEWLGVPLIAGKQTSSVMIRLGFPLLVFNP